MTYHYTYRIDNPITGEFYIGSRSSKVKPKLDIKYLGSMKTWKPDKSILIKTIIKTDFKTRESAIEYESKLISKYINDPLNRNYNIPNKGFCTFGMIRGQLSIEHKDKISKSKKEYKFTEDHYSNLSLSNSGRTCSLETKNKMSNTRSGIKLNPFSQEHKDELSKSQIGILRGPASEETKRKLSEIQLGKKRGNYNKNR